MVRSHRRRGLAGRVGTPMGGENSRRARRNPQRSDAPCPTCRVPARQPCRTIVSRPGDPIALGEPRPTLHAKRPRTGASKPAAGRAGQRARAAAPVDISKIDPGRDAFVPRNQRPDADCAAEPGWSREPGRLAPWRSPAGTHARLLLMFGSGALNLAARCPRPPRRSEASAVPH
jgi:hypothetical protein